MREARARIGVCVCVCGRDRARALCAIAQRANSPPLAAARAVAARIAAARITIEEGPDAAALECLAVLGRRAGREGSPMGRGARAGVVGGGALLD